MTKSIRILVVNDDGYLSPGIIALSEALTSVGQVTIVAPDRERSAIGHGLTFFSPLRVKEHPLRGGIKVFSTDGTPTDCVLLGVHQLMESKPNMVVSGINRGANMGDDVTYSGTVSAALEGVINGIPSIAVSLATLCEHGNYKPAAEFTALLAGEMLEQKLPEGVFLNVNVPAVEKQEIQGVEITCQGRTVYRQSVIKRKDPRGCDYYWITGEPPTGPPEKGTDFDAVRRNRISITPLQLSLTHTKTTINFNKWNIFNHDGQAKK